MIVLLNFIIYEEEENIRTIYKNIIHSIFASNNNAYKIYEFEKYDDNFVNSIRNILGKKIFLLDIEVPGKTGIELARDIRKSGDWLSQLIIITSHDELRENNIMRRILMLDFISKCRNLDNDLRKAINVAYNILNSNKSISIKQNGEIYKIGCNEILYIEKDLNDNYVTIYTNNEHLSMKGSISSFETALKGDPRFMKIHRSCIINLNNVKSYDVTNNIVKFENNSIDLVARNKKKELKEKLLQFK